MSISGGILIGIIIIIRVAALNKLPKVCFLMLWAVVLLRLFIPVYLPVQLNIQPINGLINTINADNNTVSSQHNEYIQKADGSGLPLSGFLPENRLIGTLNNISPIILIWITGMILLFIFFAFIFVKSHRKLRFASLINDNTHIKNWLVENELLRKVTIMQSDQINTPLAVGFIKPRIVLPQRMDLNDKQLLDYVLMHEYCHIKRFDALWKIVIVFAVCVHWFNPLVWVMFFLLNRDLESSCDEQVVRRFGISQKSDYAYSIIGMSECSNRLLLHSAYNRKSSVLSMKKRIEAVMRIKEKSIVSIVVSAFLVYVFAIGALPVFITNNHDEEVLTESPITVSNYENQVESFEPDYTNDSTEIYLDKNDNADSYQTNTIIAESDNEGWTSIVRVEKLFSDDEPTITIFLPDGYEFCGNYDDVPEHLIWLVDETLSKYYKSYLDISASNN